MKLAAALVLIPSLAYAADSVTLAVTTPAQVATTRAALINAAYGISTGVLPRNMPNVTQGVSDPYAGAVGSLLRVDKYSFTHLPSGALDSSDISAYYYIPASPNGQRIAFNPGHSVPTCNWPSHPSAQHQKETLTALLAAGYSVLATNMPGCGAVSVHQALVSSLASAAIQYFVEPTVEAANYWDTTGGNGYYGATGLSGGGFTTMLAMALDTRFVVGVDVAGNLMGTQFTCPGNPNIGDAVSPPSTQAEQSITGYYTSASFVDHYLLSAAGVGRMFIQVRNYSDDCCFGNPQWNSCLSTLYGMSWSQFLRDYMYRQVRMSAVPTSYNVIIDTTSTVHQISDPFAKNIIVGAMNTYLRQPPAAKRFRR